MGKALLEVKNLKKYYNVPKGLLHAVNDASFTIAAGKTLGIVGESDYGKTTADRVILRLIEPTSGQIVFDGEDITKLNKNELRHMQLIFQDPFSSLNPRITVSEAIEEPIMLANIIPEKNKRLCRFWN